MKRKNTLWSLVLALVMVLGVFAPLSALASSTEMPKETIGKIESTDVSTTKPGSTELTIHKLKAESYDLTKVPAKHNGGLLSKDDLQSLVPKGTTVEELDGVTFTCYKLKDAAQLKTFKDDPDSYKTVEQVDKVAGVTKLTKETDPSVEAPLITKDKKGVTVNLPEGYYWFVESDKPKEVSSSIAVPFGISLPVTNPVEIKDGQNKTHDAGTVYLKKVHVYPKNVTGDLPNVDKDVNEIGQKTANFNVGDSVTWFIKGDIPSNLKDYKAYSLTDDLDKQLTYVKKLKVVYGKYADKKALDDEKNTIDGVTYKTGIVPESYYELTQPEANAKGGKLELKLTDTGLKNLNADGQSGNKLYFYFETKINEDAIMGKDIENNVKLTFDNNSGQKQDPKEPSKKPKVVTGGKRFVKVDAANKEIKLKDAVFTIKHKKGGAEKVTDWTTKDINDLTWTADLIKANEAAIKAGKFATKTKDKEIYTATSAQNMPIENTPIYLRSNDQGEFEIKGLKYSEFTPKKWNGTDLVDLDKVYNHYALKEVKAPEGFGLNEKAFDFTIDKNSYYTAPDEVTVGTTDGTATPDEIENKKLTIPQTGGMGTMIFMVAGLALMGGAFIAMRKRSAEQA